MQKTLYISRYLHTKREQEIVLSVGNCRTAPDGHYSCWSIVQESDRGVGSIGGSSYTFAMKLTNVDKHQCIANLPQRINSKHCWSSLVLSATAACTMLLRKIETEFPPPPQQVVEAPAFFVRTLRPQGIFIHTWKGGLLALWAVFEQELGIRAGYYSYQPGVSKKNEPTNE